MSEIGPLAGGVLEQNHRSCARPLRQQRTNRVADQAQSFLFRPGRIRTRVHDQTVESECLGPVVLIAERVDRLRPQSRGCRRQVDQVAVVGDDGMNAGFGHAPAKECNLFVR